MKTYQEVEKMIDENDIKGIDDVLSTWDSVVTEENSHYINSWMDHACRKGNVEVVRAFMIKGYTPTEHNANIAFNSNKLDMLAFLKFHQILPEKVRCGTHAIGYQHINEHVWSWMMKQNLIEYVD